MLQRVLRTACIRLHTKFAYMYMYIKDVCMNVCIHTCICNKHEKTNKYIIINSYMYAHVCVCVYFFPGKIRALLILHCPPLTHMWTSGTTITPFTGDVSVALAVLINLTVNFRNRIYHYSS